MTVAVVTDSTSDLPPGLADALGVRVVPLSVTMGGRDLFSRVSMSDEEFYAELEASEDELPTTSQPGTAWFEEAWADAVDAGHDAIVSIHLSTALSGTVDRARALAPSAPVPVAVVDSRQVSGGLALQVLGATRVAAAGGSVDDVVAAAEAVRAATLSGLIVHTLEYLRRGGRLNAAQAAVGTALRVRPVLGVRGGRLELLDRARTWARASQRLVERIEAAAGDEPQHVVLAHAVAEERAEELLAMVAERIDIAEELRLGIGPVVGTHTGPGAVGVSLAPARLT